MSDSSLGGGSRRAFFACWGLCVCALGLLASWSAACRGENTAKPARQAVAAAPAPSPGLAFFTLPPCRVLDTRVQGQGPALTSGTARQVAIATKCGIPSSAVSVAANVTAINPADDGTLSFYPNPTGQPPSASALSFTRGKTRANNTVLTLNTTQKDGTVQALATLRPGGTVDLLIDVNGYFAPGAPR